MEKMKTGKLVEVATVVRNLLVRENEKGLSGAEKKMLNNARQIVISEIVYSQGNMEKDAAEKFMSEALFSK
jgi:CarD family transcriptional regulator